MTTTRSGLANFSDGEAWELIASHIDDGKTVYTTTLDNPPGAEAFVIFEPPEDKWPGLYIKFQLTGPGIYGRSFHHPERPTIEMDP